MPARHVPHVGQSMRDPFVAINARFLPCEQETLMRLRGTRRLLGDVHRCGAVTVAALERVVRLHPRPLVQSEFEPIVDKFLARVDPTRDVTPNFF